MHGIVMVWFFLVPVVPVTLGNFVIPLMIGARDLAFPKLNLLSWYLFVAAGIVLIYALFAGGLDTGWTFYTPFSSNFSNGHLVAAVTAVFISGFSLDRHRIEFHRDHSPPARAGDDLVPHAGVPVVALRHQRHLRAGNTGAGDDAAAARLRADLQHRRVRSDARRRSAVVPAPVLVLLAPGRLHHDPARPRRHQRDRARASRANRIFGYKFVVWCSIAIAVISFLVWGHHMFVAGTSLYSALVFSILSYMVAVPSAIKVFNWIGTMHKGYIRFDAPMLYALGFIGLFTIGGLTGLFVAALAADVHLSQTYFVVAHFHYVMVGGMVSAFFAGIHYWWPKITGRMYPEMWGRAGALIIFIGFNLTFFPQFILGYLGMPRRYHSYPAGIRGAERAVVRGRVDPRGRLSAAARSI